MNLDLANQVVFVAGASRGIGLAIARAVLAEGANIVLTGRDRASLQNASIELERLGTGRVLAVEGDLVDRQVIDGAFEKTIQRFGRLDHVICNLGTGAGRTGWDLPDEEWERLFDLNFFGSVRLAQAALPYLVLNNSGSSIIFIASITGIEATHAPLPYSAAKAALLNYAKNLSRQLGSQNVRVNSVAPGNISFSGSSWEARAESMPNDVQAMLAAEVPQQRFGTPDEIASLVTYLCSPKAAFATGGCYVMDGGQTRGR